MGKDLLTPVCGRELHPEAARVPCLCSVPLLGAQELGTTGDCDTALHKCDPLTSEKGRRDTGSNVHPFYY